MIVATAINAYLFDCYPEGSGEVRAWVTASRNWAGFMLTYIQIAWGTREAQQGLLVLKQASLWLRHCSLSCFRLVASSYDRRKDAWSST